MGAGASRVLGRSDHSEDEQTIVPEDTERRRSQDTERRRSSNRRQSELNTAVCPTCQGTGRIPQGQENKMVAVIPCNDQRLKPRHTKKYVMVSVILSLLVCSLVLFFLFPRSIILSPVIVKSAYVYFTPATVLMNITHIVNMTNENFASVEVSSLSGQLLFFETVVGTISIKNVTAIPPLSERTLTVLIPVTLNDPGLNNYCKSTSIKIHTLFLHLQVSMTLYYLAHYEQVSVDTFEYIDCGSNTTTPHVTSNHPSF